MFASFFLFGTKELLYDEQREYNSKSETIRIVSFKKVLEVVTNDSNQTAEK